jgi:hypothetical protein
MADLESSRVTQLPERFLGKVDPIALQYINQLLLVVRALQKDVKALEQRLKTLEGP